MRRLNRSVAETTGVGLTVIVNVRGVPTHVAVPTVKDGVTVMVATIGSAVAFLATKEAILPVPEAARPIAVLLLVQLYVTVPPVLEDVNEIPLVVAPLQIATLLTAFTVAVGLTVMVKDLTGPTQLIPPLVNVGVTTIVATAGADPLLTPVNDAMLPVPEAASPIAVLLLVQLYVVVPAVAVVAKLTALLLAVLQITWLLIALTTPTGLTVIVKVLGVPAQVVVPVVTDGVTVIVATKGAVPLLVALKAAILPVPDAASPIAGVLLVQPYDTVPEVILDVKFTGVVALPLQSN